MGRNWRVDTLRGYFLMCMTLGHFANPLAKVTEYTFGYASSPDGFVFLSGLVSAWVYLPLLNQPRSAMSRKIYRRAGIIYLTHIALVVTALIAALHPGMATQKINRAWQTLVSGAMLTNQTGFDRILPMYIVFLAFTPLILRQFAAGRAWLIGIISAALWGAAQVGIGDWMPLDINRNQGNFNLLAWQAYFVAGQYLGYRGLREGTASLPKSRFLLTATAIVAALIMIDRHALIAQAPFFDFSGHPDHNPIRFLDAACLGYLIWRVPRSIDLALMKLRFFRFLNLLGGHSLQVFAFSMLLSRLEAHSVENFPWIGKAIVAVLTVLSLAIPASIHQMLRRGSLDPVRAAFSFGGGRVASDVGPAH